MSLQWNAASFASGVTVDGQSEAMGIKRIEEEEGKLWDHVLICRIPSLWHVKLTSLETLNS